MLSLSSGCLALVVLTLAAPALAAPVVTPDAPVSLSVSAEFERERKGDGSPRVRYRFTLTNLTDRPLHVSRYHPPYLSELGPKRAFRIEKVQRRPHKLRPVGKADLLTIGAGAGAVIDDEQWTASFSLDADEPAYIDSYRLRRPARIEMRFCFSSSSAAALAALLPPGEQLWQGTVCAHPVRVRITQLPSDPR
jgi:hypothetical protein